MTCVKSVEHISTGFPSPADDYLERRLDLNEFLVQNPAATFMVRVRGESMINAGIHHGDILIVDRSQEARHGSIVIAAVNGVMTVKRLYLKNNQCQLHAENPKDKPIHIQEAQDLYIWGVAMAVIRKL